MVATKANPFRIAHVLTPTPGPATRIEAVSWDASQAGPKPGCFINRNPSITRRPAVPDGLGDGVTRVADNAVVRLVMQLGELGPDLRLVPAGDFLAAPLAVGPGFEADHATPSSALTWWAILGSNQ